MISFEEVVQIHDILIEKFGGKKGIRDKNLLESALKRPFQTFDNKDLYDSPIEKSAAIFESLIKNHPFVDGNKRIAYVLMRVILLQYNLDIKANEAEKYRFVIEAAKGKINFEQIKEWIHKQIKVID